MARKRNGDGPAVPDIDDMPIDQCVPWYLVHSYLYYELDAAVLKDAVFDRICERLYREFDDVTHHHGYLLDRDALRASTGFHLKREDYPTIVAQVALNIRDGRFDAWGNPTRKSPIYYRDTLRRRHEERRKRT